MTRLSYSQGQTLNRCGEAWRLERRHRKVGRPSWAAIGGTALHNITEATDLNQHGEATYIPGVPDAIEDAIAHELERSNGRWGREDIRSFGRATKAWPEKENRAWWEHHLPVFLASWEAWKGSTPWRLWMTPDGKPAVEVEIDVELDSQDEPLKGFIDRVFEDPRTGRLIVVDLKSGRAPKSSQQLGIYRLGLWQKYGMLADFGTYWLARTGMTSEVYDLSEWHDDRLSFEFGVSRALVEQNLLAPSVGDNCSWCSVREWCYAVGGEHADEVPRPWADRAATDRPLVTV